MNSWFSCGEQFRCTELFCESLNFIIHLVVDCIWANCLHLKKWKWHYELHMVKNSGGLNCQREFVKLQPVAFSHRSVQIISLGFPQIFFHIYLLGFCSNCLLLCSGFNKYLKISKISNDIKLWFSSIRWKARLLSVLMHLFFFVFVSIFVFVFIIVFYVQSKAHK